jgi:FtsP/CotA-like multicopper oxidase with cupredoxin domain
MASAVIVLNKDYAVPEEVRSALQVVLMVQDINKAVSSDAQFSGDTLLQLEFKDEFRGQDISGKTQFLTVNGQMQPRLTVDTGKWYRFRIIYGSPGWGSQPLDFWLDSIVDGEYKCDAYLLAKDSVYINDYPNRVIGESDGNDEYMEAHVPAGGRADIMVRCNEAGEFTARSFVDDDLVNENGFLFTVDSRLPPGATDPTPFIQPGPTEDFNFFRPGYLQDLQNENVKESCKCSTYQSGCEFGAAADPTTRLCPDTGRFPGQQPFPSINGQYFEEDKYVHVIPFGETVQRTIGGITAHPYHMHVQPYQLFEGFPTGDLVATENGYFQNGDWHDVIISQGGVREMEMRFRADIFDGKLMLHCHRLNHEDQGMMSQELILKSTDQCACGFEASVQIII